MTSNITEPSAVAPDVKATLKSQMYCSEYANVALASGATALGSVIGKLDRAIQRI